MQNNCERCSVQNSIFALRKVDIAYWHLFLTVTIYEFIYLTNTILLESWCIISHISSASLLNLVLFFYRFLLSEHWRNIWEPQQRQFWFRFCTRPCFKKYVRVNNNHLTLHEKFFSISFKKGKPKKKMVLKEIHFIVYRWCFSQCQLNVPLQSRLRQFVHL